MLLQYSMLCPALVLYKSLNWFHAENFIKRSVVYIVFDKASHKLFDLILNFLLHWTVSTIEQYKMDSVYNRTIQKNKPNMNIIEPFTVTVVSFFCRANGQSLVKYDVTLVFLIYVINYLPTQTSPNYRYINICPAREQYCSYHERVNCNTEMK